MSLEYGAMSGSCLRWWRECRRRALYRGIGKSGQLRRAGLDPPSAAEARIDQYIRSTSHRQHVAGQCDLDGGSRTALRAERTMGRKGCALMAEPPICQRGMKHVVVLVLCVQMQLTWPFGTVPLVIVTPSDRMYSMNSAMLWL